MFILASLQKVGAMPYFFSFFLIFITYLFGIKIISSFFMFIQIITIIIRINVKTLLNKFSCLIRRSPVNFFEHRFISMILNWVEINLLP